nr:Down syndrome cell adhesion molecule-like protein Dscam2 isoform X3 [Procambarus clarkii]
MLPSHPASGLPASASLASTVLPASVPHSSVLSTFPEAASPLLPSSSPVPSLSLATVPSEAARTVLASSVVSQAPTTASSLSHLTTTRVYIMQGCGDVGLVLLHALMLCTTRPPSRPHSASRHQAEMLLYHSHDPGKIVAPHLERDKGQVYQVARPPQHPGHRPHLLLPGAWWSYPDHKDGFSRGPPAELGTRGPPAELGTRGPPAELGTRGPPAELGTRGPPAELGTRGPPAEPGTRGPPAEPGTRGPPAEPGTRGPPAEPGTRGPPAEPGTRGPPAEPGTRGPPAEPGTRGPPAEPGTRGPPAEPGTRGPPAEPGTRGPPAEPGSRGPPAELGSRGPPAELGTRGPPAELGTRGPPAELGTRGPPAELGTRGPPAELGTRGPPAERGTRGPPAELGSRGPPAELGSRGPPAELGSRGPPAELGSRGPPAELGSRGPPAELGSRGPPAELGSRGPPAEPGTRGPPAEPGTRGPPAELGTRGPPAPGGPRGLPVEGGPGGLHGPPVEGGPRGPPTEVPPRQGDHTSGLSRDLMFQRPGDHHSQKAWRRAGVQEWVSGGLRRASRDLGLNPYSQQESAPQLRYTPIEQTVSPGSPVSLKCSAIGSPVPVLTWSRDHQPLLTSHRTRVGSFRTELGEVVSQVNLSSVTVRDGGSYTCTAHNTHGSVAHSARLNVYGPPFVRAMPNVTAVAGEDVRLWCPAGGFPAPTITWRREGLSLPTSLRQEVVMNGTLVVRSANHDDVGRYTCVVSGRQGETTASHTFLHVLKPPAIEPFSFRRNLHEGERTQLTCMVNSGDLPITINWLKDGAHLQHDPDIDSKQIHEYSTVLLFKKLREHHTGSYTCEAANAAATTNHTATVRVKVSPRWVVEPVSATAVVGSTVVLDCSARGFPHPAITWLKAPGKSAEEFQSVVLEGVRSSQAANGSLVLTELSTASAGWYLCRAANSVGKPLSKVVQLTVHAPARVVTEGGRVTGHAGQTVTVACEATGDPPLALTWHRHHAPISPGHRVSVRESRVGGLVRAVLEIRAVTSGDAGTYTCRATNPHGDHSHIFDIAIIEPPTAPSGVVVSDVGSRSARLSWSLPQPAAVTIQYRAEEESWASHGRNVSVGQWAAWHLLTGLTPYHTYAVRLMAHNDLGVSQPSLVHVFTTTEEAPSGAPQDVHVTAGGAYSLVVTWRAPAPHLTHGPLRGYTIALRRQNLQGHLTYITRPITTASGDTEVVEQYEVRGLTPASLYEVAVRAFNRAGPGPLSSPRIVDSTSHDAPSCPPAGVSCRGSGRGGVRVWWSPPPAHCAHAPVQGYTIIATPTDHRHTSGSSRWEVNTTNLEKNLDGLPPATNISVRVKAFNEVGYSSSSHPIFCLTEDDVPGPPRRVRVVVTGGSSLLVTWVPPQPYTGTILHYTLYSARDDQVAVRDVVGVGGSEATWREVNGLTPGSRVQVWVTAATVAGEGSQSPRLTALPIPTSSHPPIAVGGGRAWRVGAGSGVTLGCRGLGSPPPNISWTKGSSSSVSSEPLTQLLPGGDLHLTAVRETANYTCWVSNSVGVDSLTHLVVAVTAPLPPTLTLAHATHHALNLTITPADDGGAPILGYTVHHRQPAGEWVETTADPGVGSLTVRGLPCGAPHHLYLTAWNSHGTSTPSAVLVTNTLGSAPGRPDPAKLVEVNETCVTLRLYIWPELGCPVTHWKVELGREAEEESWAPLYAHVTRDTTDLGLCDLTSATWHLLRVTAASTAGDTCIVYRVATMDHSGGSISAEPVQEVVMKRPAAAGSWLDAHVVAGMVSALLLAAALIICVCVAVRRRRYGGYSRQGENLENKGGGEDDNARNSELTRAHLYSPTPTKKPRGSLASLKTQDETSDPYEICPYATFSVGSSEGTLEYGLSLHAMNPRECLDHPGHPDHSDRLPHHHQSPAYPRAPRQRSLSQFKETEISYISNRNRAEYGSRPKSMPGAQPPAASPVPAGGTVEQITWAADTINDARSRPHRSRSRTREATRRDSSTESNDASSPVQQRQHYQHPQMPPPPQQQQQQQLAPQQQQLALQQQPLAPQQQQLAPQQQQALQQQQQQQAAVRVGPHPLPPVRHARVRSDSSSSETSPLTPPRPLHPPSAFSDSRELSEAECDREMAQATTGNDASQARNNNGKSNRDSLPAELTVLLQHYEQHQQHYEHQQHAPQSDQQRGSQKSPYSINV